MNDPISAKVRHVVFGELAVVAAKINNVAYELAIRANRVQGWLIRQRDAR
jgi:hypothetical protein